MTAYIKNLEKFQTDRKEFIMADIYLSNKLVEQVSLVRNAEELMNMVNNDTSINQKLDFNTALEIAIATNNNSIEKRLKNIEVLLTGIDNRV